MFEIRKLFSMQKYFYLKLQKNMIILWIRIEIILRQNILFYCIVLNNQTNERN